MSLTLEWQRRIERWRTALWGLCYRPLGDVPVRGFATTAYLSAADALRGPLAAMPVGTRWGAKWEYGWFQGDIVLPDAARDKRIVLRLDVGGEGLVWVNGEIAGAKDREHTEITLAKRGVPGDRYTILAESYAGHGPMVEGGGPVPYGTETVPEPGAAQVAIGLTTFGIWEEDVYQLALDLDTLYTLRGSLDPNSLRVAEIDQALEDATVIADPELPWDEMLPTIRAARERLKPLLACTNGTTMPTLFAIGHGHLDVAWLWPLQETERKMARTVSNQLALAAEYPEHRFIQTQPHLFRMLKNRYPELYERFKAAVKAGNIVPEGGMWIEADTNLSGGESLIRQFIHGKRFLREEVGTESELLWLPDVFGYSGNMPQIMQGCGVHYFATAKILWAYNGGDPFPYSIFTWEGIDGSQVLAHIFFNYGNETHPDCLINLWATRNQKMGISSSLFVFGHGDGGGGPTRLHLEYLRREPDLEGVPRARLASPIEFFKDVERRGTPKARHVGELYFQAHRGTYTSQARTKQGNRKSELALREAELWGTAARALRGYKLSLADLDTAWKAVLLNQFHDILPGSSITRVYQEAEAAFEGVQNSARQIAQDAASAFTGSGDAVTVFNSLSWPRQALVPLPAGTTGVSAADGSALPTQQIGDQTYTLATLPPCGWTSLGVSSGAVQPPAPSADQPKANEHLLENEYLRVGFNATGEIVSIFDKETGRELAAGVCNHFQMYKDVPGWFDAWDLDSNYIQMPVELSGEARIEVVTAGPLVAAIRVSRQLHNSMLSQEIRLRRGSRRLDFITTVEWLEKHKVLKVAFPVTVHASEAVHEIQFGHIRRTNHFSKPFDEDRFEVANHKWSALIEENRGVAILNDCKYGLNVYNNTINLTLLKSALSPDMYADRGTQRFTYSFYAWSGSFADSPVINEAYELNCPPLVVRGRADEVSLFRIDAPNVLVETVKPAEDGSADVIVRLYEAKRTATCCTLSTILPFKRVVQTDMLEHTTNELASDNGQVRLDFRPFEIKTVRLVM